MLPDWPGWPWTAFPFPQPFVSFSWWILSVASLDPSLLGLAGISSRLRFHVGDDSVAKASSLSGSKQSVAPRSPILSMVLDSIEFTLFAFLRVPDRFTRTQLIPSSRIARYPRFGRTRDDSYVGLPSSVLAACETRRMYFFVPVLASPDKVCNEEMSGSTPPFSHFQKVIKCTQSTGTQVHKGTCDVLLTSVKTQPIDHDCDG